MSDTKLMAVKSAEKTV